MFDYYVSILKLAIFVFCGLTVTSAFCAVGWFLSDRELKKERFRTNMFKAKCTELNRLVVNLTDKNKFLDNRVNELAEDVQSLSFENVGLEDKLHKALAAVRENVSGDTENQGKCDSSEETAG